MAGKIWFRRLLLTGASALAMIAGAQAGTWDFGYSGSVTFWTAPATGSYDVTAWGAQGGSALSGGGLGAEMGGDITLAQGTTLGVLVGGQGGNDTFGYGYAGGGGGGSFVFVNPSTPLVAAGGGGGGGFLGVPGRPGLATRSGSAGSNGGFTFSGGAGGTYGSGGGGGGSYLANAFTNTVEASGVRYGDGYVAIRSVPEPSTWAMIAIGFGAVGFLGLRRGQLRKAIL